MAGAYWSAPSHVSAALFDGTSGPWPELSLMTLTFHSQGHEPLGLQRDELYGREVNVTGRKVPDWLASSSRSGNGAPAATVAHI